MPMRKTPYIPPDEAPSAKRYMESAEFIELRGISADIVARKAALIEHRCKRQLLWFLQAMSVRPGGLNAIAVELMDKLPTKIKGMISYYMRDGDDVADELLVAVCVNPRLWLPVPALDLKGHEVRYRQEVRRQHPTLNDYEFDNISSGCLEGVMSALLELYQRHRERVRSEFVMTEVAEKVFATLDTALESPGRIAMLEGREGVGKSESARAWCEQNLGEARFVSLSGITNRTAFFGALARALGIATRSYAAAQLQSRIEQLLQETKLMLVIDEAHHLFGASDRFRTQPELINWVYASCANFGVPLALITTAMFGRKMRQAEQQVVWNAGQFERRVRPYVKLPDVPRMQDLKAVAHKLLPKASATTIEIAVGYAGSTRFPYTNLVDAVKDSRRIAERAGRAEPSHADMKSAVLDVRGPSDKAAAEAFAAPPRRARSRDSQPRARPFKPGCNPVKEGFKRDTFAGYEPAETQDSERPLAVRPDRDLMIG
jgi:hypothetical protein